MQAKQEEKYSVGLPFITPMNESMPNLLLLPVSSEISETYFTPYTRFVHNKRTNGEETLVTANLWYPQRQPNNNFSFGYYYFEPFTPTSARADGVVVDKFPKFNAKNEEGTTVKKKHRCPFHYR